MMSVDWVFGSSSIMWSLIECEYAIIMDLTYAWITTIKMAMWWDDWMLGDVMIET